MRALARWLPPIILVVLVTACTRAPVRLDADVARMEGLQAREAVLASQPDWALVGRISVSDGRDGGSGRIEWWQRGEQFEIRLSAPVSRQSWRLSGSPGQARLDGVDGGPLQGADAQVLLYEATGWLIPLRDMAHWIRGGRGEGFATVSFDEQGRPALLQQSGWVVEYRDWLVPSAAGLGLPRRVFAEQGEARVRLVVERWDVPPDGA